MFGTSEAKAEWSAELRTGGFTCSQVMLGRQQVAPGEFLGFPSEK